MKNKKLKWTYWNGDVEWELPNGKRLLTRNGREIIEADRVYSYRFGDIGYTNLNEQHRIKAPLHRKKSLMLKRFKQLLEGWRNYKQAETRDLKKLVYAIYDIGEEDKYFKDYEDELYRLREIFDRDYKDDPAREMYKVKDYLKLREEVIALQE